MDPYLVEGFRIVMSGGVKMNAKMMMKMRTKMENPESD